MPAPRINMRKLKDALRLKFEGQQSRQQIATALGIFDFPHLASHFYQSGAVQRFLFMNA